MVSCADSTTTLHVNRNKAGVSLKWGSLGTTQPYPFDLGPYSWPVSTKNTGAQIWFDRGLNWLYGFNHEEAVVCFRTALDHDPNLAIAWWGVAYASGPFYNMPWRIFTRQEGTEATKVCFDAAQSALALIKGASPQEAALIKAVVQRYQSNKPVNIEVFDQWDRDYADAMRAVRIAFPDNLDVLALTAEAVMILTPWQLWDVHSGKVAEGAATAEALEILEHGIALTDNAGALPHQAILHLHIHVLEMSDTPEAALRSADRLGGPAPDLGHLEHMPGHIYCLCGLYQSAITCSEKAILADRKYLAHAGSQNFYTTARCHDLHLMMYAAMMAGRFKPAIAAAVEMTETLSPEVLKTEKNHMAITVEGYFATKMHVLVRFGRWQDIIDEAIPDDPVLYPVTTAMFRYARAVACAALGRVVAADAEAANFHQAVAAVPANRLIFNNQAHDILAVGAAMMAGEIAYRKGDFDVAYDHLREAAHRDDHLMYTEPWAWMHPPRHALGALLLEQGRLDDAEAVYRDDLGYSKTLPRCCQHPANVWALHGFAECLRRNGKTAELKSVAKELRKAVATTDTPITSSCCCRNTAD